MAVVMAVMMVVIEVDGGGGKSVEKSSKSRRIVKKVQKFQKSKKFAKAIGLEERLPKHQSSVNEIRGTRTSVGALSVFRAFLLGPGALSIPRLERLPTRQSWWSCWCSVAFFRNRRSSSQEHLSLSLAVTNGFSAPKFLSARRSPSLC